MVTYRNNRLNRLLSTYVVPYAQEMRILKVERK